MPILASIAIASGGLIVGLYLLFKRVDAADRLDENLLSVAVPSGLRLERVKKLSKSEALVLKDAFVGSLEFDWMAEKSPEKRKELAHNMIDYVISCGQGYGHVIVCRNDSNGDCLGVIIMFPPYRFKSLFDLHFMRSAIPLGPPLAHNIGPVAKERFEAFCKATSKHHSVAVGSTPHWYVMNLGVAKAAQGKGVGSLLISTAKKLAGDLPVYLECHNGNVNFYKKHGFEQSEFSLGKEKFPYNGMIHRLES